MNVNSYKQDGLSLVEVMISVVLGLFISTVVITLFIQHKNSFNQDEMIAEMQENGRHAMDILSRDLMMADFWGTMTSPAGIDKTGLTITAVNDCGQSSDANWAYDVTRHLQFVRQASPSGAHTEFSCIADSEVPGSNTDVLTDVLVVKRVSGAFTADDNSENNHVYLRTNGTVGTLFVCSKADNETACNNTPAVSGGQNWEYFVNMYYIRKYTNSPSDGIPALYRKHLSPENPPKMETEGGGIAQGIESFHVQFGVDTDADGTANYYSSTPNQAQLADSVSARIYVLVRSVRRDPGYLNNKTYQLGDLTLTVNDNYYRRVYSTTAMLRNPAYLNNFPG